MTARRSKNYWLLIIILLIAVAIMGSLLAGLGCGTQPIEISRPDDTNLEETSQIYIGGAVNNPGFYPLKGGDSLQDLIQAAGGTTDSADLSWLELRIPRLGEAEAPQKIDLNRAPVWLLEALPGIGEVKAQAIIDHRQQNGSFSNINELLDVDGIGQGILENIKDLITVAD